MEREKLSSRLGFILLSAGCAIGIGNVWRFPYVAGRYGGGAFVLFYLFFLAIMGLPVMTMEFAVGRASKKSVIRSFHELEPKGTKWHWHGYVGLAGNYCLMMFYTTVAGWMLYYFYLMLTGRFTGADAGEVGQMFGSMLAKPGVMAGLMLFVVVVGFGICSAGLQSGVERITKGMMAALLGIMVLLAIHSLTMEGGAEGLAFYLKPDFGRMMEVGIGETMVGAMNQAFFTLSLGIGAMMIFGSYLDNRRNLTGESMFIVGLDTFVALTSGLIIFPACFSFNVQPDAGPSLIFITLPQIFVNMAGGRLWGALFFLFMTFASFSTVMAFFENIISFAVDMFGTSRRKAVLVNGAIVLIASLPCVLGYNVWSSLRLIGGRDVLDSEDFIVSNLLLPIGSLIYLLFCVTRFGWGFDKYYEECNQGEGLKFQKALKPYFQFVLPVLIVAIILQGLLR